MIVFFLHVSSEGKKGKKELLNRQGHMYIHVMWPRECTWFFQVSWIRMSDLRLMSVGRYTYTTDLRFEALHSAHTDDWILRLKRPKPSDSGAYGCQISIEPHPTHTVYLTVNGKLTFLPTHSFVFSRLFSLLEKSFSTCVQPAGHRMIWVVVVLCKTGFTKGSHYKN